MALMIELLNWEGFELISEIVTDIALGLGKLRSRATIIKMTTRNIKNFFFPITLNKPSRFKTFLMNGIFIKEQILPIL